MSFQENFKNILSLLPDLKAEYKAKLDAAIEKAKEELCPQPKPSPVPNPEKTLPVNEQNPQSLPNPSPLMGQVPYPGLGMTAAAVGPPYAYGGWQTSLSGQAYPAYGGQEQMYYLPQQRQQPYLAQQQAMMMPQHQDLWSPGQPFRPRGNANSNLGTASLDGVHTANTLYKYPIEDPNETVRAEFLSKLRNCISDQK